MANSKDTQPHANTIHGHVRRIGGKQVKSITYQTWHGMINRCTNPRATQFHFYGGRGITVCERWRTFANFLADVGGRPSKQHSLDRHPDKNGNYEPGNVRWATQTEQCNNTRSTRLVTAFGRTQSVTQWSRETGLSDYVIAWRLKRGWPIEVALTKPKRPKRLALPPV